MKTTKKRILALVLVALMVMFNVPFVGFAVDVDEPTRYSVIGNDKGGNVEFLWSSDDSTFLDNTDSHLSVWKSDSGSPSPFITIDIDGSTAEWTSTIPISYVYVKTGNEAILNPQLYIDDGKKDKDNDNGSYGYLYDYTDYLALTDTVGTDGKGISHVSFYYEEPEYGYLTIEKEILENQELPDGIYEFSFQIYQGKVAIGQPITISVNTTQGLTKLSEPIKLVVGQYIVSELNPIIIIFEVIENDIPVTISESHTSDIPASITIENEYVPKGSFTLVKNMSTDSDPLTEDKTFEFGIYENKDLPQDSLMPDPFKTVTLTVKEGETTASESVELPYGDYYVRELGTEVTGSLFTLVTPENNVIRITIDDADNGIATFTNKYMAPTGVITVIKEFELADGVEAELPSEPHFAFDIINVETDEVVASFNLPNEDGDYQFTSNSLPLGNYKVHEKSMDLGFKVVENDKIVEIDHDGAAVPPYMVTIENVYDPSLGNLIVKKAIESTVVGVPIPGQAKFEFELLQGDAVVKVDGKDSFFIDTLGGNGQVTLYGLEAGTYTIEEINLGHNYTVSPAAVEVTVNANATVTAQTITNYYTPDPEIQIEVQKVIVDANGSPVSSQNNVNFTLALEPTEPTSEYDYEVLATKPLQRTTFKNLFTFSVNAKDKDALSYVEYPYGFTRAYDMEETNLPQYFGFKSFKVDYHFGDEVVSETSTENDFELRIFGQDRESYPDKIVITVTNTYTPPTPPVIPPEDDEPRERRIIPTEPVPLASPTTEAAVPEEVPEELLPLAPVTLPKTGEVPATLFYGIGGMISALGVFLRRK